MIFGIWRLSGVCRGAFLFWGGKLATTPSPFFSKDVILKGLSVILR
jgi:hypothetical protein